MSAIDYILDGIQLRGDGQAVSIASGANPFSPRAGGGTTYRDFSIWSVWESINWQAGAGKINPADGGYLHAEAETRVPNKATLPSKIMPATVDTVNATSTDRAHFAEYAGTPWLGYGKILYKWDEPTKTFVTKIVYGFAITDIAEFAGVIFVALGDAANMESVVADSLVQTTESIRADIIYPFGGLLYVATLGSVYYTNYVPTVAWTGPLRISSDNITGMAGMMNGTMLEQIMYISTSTSLYALLVGDIVMQVSYWPGYSTLNGVGMINHMGDVYVPLGRSMLRITSSGDMIPMGPDLAAGLAREYDGVNIQLVSTLAFLYTLITPTQASSESRPSVWGWSGEGWHYATRGNTDTLALGAFYSRGHNRLYVMYSDGVCNYIFMPDDSTSIKRAINVAYELTGMLDTGHFYGELREIDKLWGDVVIHGCFPTGTHVNAYYTIAGDSVTCGSSWSSEDVAWTHLGYVNSDNNRLIFPDVGSKQIRFKFELVSLSSTVTPSINAVVVKYLPRIIQQWAFNISVTLPADCLTFRDGSVMAGYDQTVWDMALRAACLKVVPISFTDIDGLTYSVSITSFSRRVTNVYCAGEDTLDGDLIWTLSLLQLSGDINGE